MAALREFEAKAIRLMGEGVLTDAQFASLEALPQESRHKCTGSGYFLTLHHSSLPKDRRTLSEPTVVGESGDIRCGFVAFLGENELVLECHSWGEVDVPGDFRDAKSF